MLFLACQSNLTHSLPKSQYQAANLNCRKFPFHLLTDDKHDYSKLKTAFPNEKFKLVVQRVLRNNYGASSSAPSTSIALDADAVAAPAAPAAAAAAAAAFDPDDKDAFNQLCDIFEFMYVALR